MDGILQFLLVAGILAFGIFRQYKKEEAKKSENKPAMPIPQHKPEVEKPIVVEVPRKQTSPPKNSSLSQEGIRNTYSPITPLKNPEQTSKAQEEASEFSIHSAEEARRAIIWSEILERKY